MKLAIFPADADAAWQSRVAAEKDEVRAELTRGASAAGAEASEDAGAARSPTDDGGVGAAAAPAPAGTPREKTKKQRWDDARIHPVDAPVGTMRAMLCALMTDLEPTVKRCASELLWVLCDEQADEFTMRTGFGNAVHMLQLRGIVG